MRLVNDANKNGLPKTQLKKDYPRVGEAPFDSMRKMMSTVHQTQDGSVIQFTKGAPDEVLKRCTRAYIGGQEVPMTEEIRRDILNGNKAMGGQGPARALRLHEKVGGCAGGLLTGELRAGSGPTWGFRE